MSTALIRRSPPPVGCAMTACTSAAVMSVATTGGFALCASTPADTPATATAPNTQARFFVVITYPRGPPEGGPHICSCRLHQLDVGAVGVLEVETGLLVPARRVPALLERPLRGVLVEPLDRNGEVIDGAGRRRLAERDQGALRAEARDPLRLVFTEQRHPQRVDVERRGSIDVAAQQPEVADTRRLQAARL